MQTNFFKKYFGTCACNLSPIRVRKEQIRAKTAYHHAEQDETGQQDPVSGLTLQAGGYRFDPGHVHQPSSGKIN
jgi:hypothetical protein